VRTAFSRLGSRASAPGSRAGRFAIAGLALVLAVFAGLHLAAHPASSPARYGGIPSWLPTPTVPVGRVVQASAAHPWLAIEGDTVSVHLARGRVLVTAVGPAVPEEGRFPVPATSPCTFTVTFTRASGLVPVRPAAFTILDELGHLHHPQVTIRNGASPPAALTPGQTVSLTVKAVLPTGSGQLRWAPGGTRPIVSWDFDVEID
jgi:hypothetical protein